MRRQRHLLAICLLLGVCVVGCQANRPASDSDNRITRVMQEVFPHGLAQGWARLLTLQGERDVYWTGTGRLTVIDQDQQSVTMDAVLLIEGNKRARLRTWKLGRVMMDVLYADGQVLGVHDHRVPQEGLGALAEAMPMLTATLNQHVTFDNDVVGRLELPFKANPASPQEKDAIYRGHITRTDDRLHFKRLILTRNARTLDFQWDRVEWTDAMPTAAWNLSDQAQVIAEGLDPLTLLSDSQPPAIEEITAHPQEAAL